MWYYWIKGGAIITLFITQMEESNIRRLTKEMVQAVDPIGSNSLQQLQIYILCDRVKTRLRQQTKMVSRKLYQ